jgi:hypothetical protein
MCGRQHHKEQIHAPIHAYTDTLMPDTFFEPK